MGVADEGAGVGCSEGTAVVGRAVGRGVSVVGASEGMEVGCVGPAVLGIGEGRRVGPLCTTDNRYTQREIYRYINTDNMQIHT